MLCSRIACSISRKPALIFAGIVWMHHRKHMGRRHTRFHVGQFPLCPVPLRLLCCLHFLYALLVFPVLYLEVVAKITWLLKCETVWLLGQPSGALNEVFWSTFAVFSIPPIEICTFTSRRWFQEINLFSSSQGWKLYSRAIIRDRFSHKWRGVQ